MNEDRKKRRRSNFDKLKIDPSSAALAEEILDKKILLNIKKSKYVEDKKFFNLVNLLDKKDVIFEPEKVKRTDYVRIFRKKCNFPSVWWKEEHGGQ